MINPNRQYPKSFDPKALWNTQEIIGYLNISKATFYDMEYLIPTFKAGQCRVAFAKDVIAYAERLKQNQNPHFKAV